MTRKRAAKPARHHNVRTWSLYTSEGRLDVRVLIQLLSAWLLWLWQLLSNLRYVKSFVTSRRRLPYVIDEYGDVTYRPPKREWIRNLFSTEASIQRRLLNWIKSKIPDHRIVDLTSSWADGTALCALIEKLKPGSCPRHELLKPLQKIQNCKLGLKLVQKYFNIPASVITPEEMAYCRDAKKMKQLLSLVRYFYHYPISGQLTPSSEIENCWAKGEGLRHGLVGKKAQFVVQTPMDDVIHLVVDIQGSSGERGMEEITAAVPMRKVCKFFDGDSDGKRTEHLKSDESVMMDYQCVGEGRFVFNYMPKNSGHYTISIRWHQDDIPGSPYTVRVDDVTSSLKEGYLPAPDNVNAEGEWNYEQFGSTVIRRRSVVMETGRRLSALANQHEHRRKSSEDVRKSPDLMKQRTVTRRRVIKRVMTLGGKEVTIDRDDENGLAELQRKVSLPKLGLFETVAMAIRENRTRSPSPAIESVADDLGSQVFEDAYSDFKSGHHRIPSLKDSARENPSFFQQIRTDSNRESMDTADSSHKDEESNDSNVRSRNTSGGDSGIDLHNGKKLSSPSLEPLQSSRDSQSDEAVFYPVSTSTPRMQSHDTSSIDFETPPSSNFEISKISDLGPEPKRDVHEKFTVLQSPSLNKTCLYMTGKNVTGTMSADNLLKTDNQESDVVTQPILALPETEENDIGTAINRGKLQTSRSLGNYGESDYSETRKIRDRSSSFSRRISPKRSASPLSHRPSSPFSPRKSFDMMVEAFQQEQNRQKVAQRASLTRQSELRSLQVDCRDFSVQVNSDAIKKEMARLSNFRVRRKRRKVIASDDFGSETVESMSTMSDFSFVRRTSNVGVDSHDDVITVSTDDVTLPSMTSSVRRRSSTSTPSVSMIHGLNFERKVNENAELVNENAGFTFEKSLHEEIQLDQQSTHSSRSHASEKILKSKTSHSKIRKVRKSNFKERLETSVTKWLRNLANAEESGPDFKISKPNRQTVEPSGDGKTTSDVKRGRHNFEPKTDDESASSGRTSAKTTPSDFSIPCECANYLENKEEYTRFFGELFESELCQDCVAKYKADEKERLERQKKLSVEEMKSLSDKTEKSGNPWTSNQQNGRKSDKSKMEGNDISAEMSKSFGFDSSNPFHSHPFTGTEKFDSGKQSLPSYRPAGIQQTFGFGNQWSLSHPTEPSESTSRNPMATIRPVHVENHESPWPSTVILDKRLLIGSRETSPKDLTDFVVRESWTTLGEGPKPATGMDSVGSAQVDFFKRGPDSETRHGRYFERKDQRSRFSDHRNPAEKYDEVRNSFQLTAQERRHYEYKPGTPPHLQGSDEKQPHHEKRWSPEHWQDITETSYLELPTRRRKGSSDEEGAKSMNFSVSALGTGDILAPATSGNFSPRPTTLFQSATNIVNSHQLGSELPNYENWPKSSTSTLDSRKSGLSCQTCPSDTTSSLTQGQGQGRRFSDSASPNSPNTERRRNLMQEINQILQQKPAKLAAFQDDDVIQQTSEINKIFSGMEFLKQDFNESGNSEFKERNFGVSFEHQNAAPYNPNFSDAIPSTKTNGFLKENPQEGRFSRAVTKRLPSPERKKNLSRSSSQSSIGRQFLDELEDLLKKHSEAKELGYGEIPQPGMCQALGSGLSYGNVGQKNNFQVRTAGAGNGSLSLSIHGPVPHCVTETTVLYTGDSLYEVLYQVSRPGYYIISVKWSDVNIPNSPFICKVEQ